MHSGGVSAYSANKCNCYVGVGVKKFALLSVKKKQETQVWGSLIVQMKQEISMQQKAWGRPFMSTLGHKFFF